MQMLSVFHRFCVDMEPYPVGGTRLNAVWRTYLCNFIHGGEDTTDKYIAPASLRADFC